MPKRVQKTRPIEEMPSTLVHKGRTIKGYYADSIQGWFLDRYTRCVNYKGRVRKCKCLLKVDDAFLSSLERYVDTTWKLKSFDDKVAVANYTVAVAGFGTKGRYLMPFIDGAFFHPVCAHTWVRLLGCTVEENKAIVRALERLPTRVGESLSRQSIFILPSRSTSLSQPLQSIPNGGSILEDTLVPAADDFEEYRELAKQMTMTVNILGGRIVELGNLARESGAVVPFLQEERKDTIIKRHYEEDIEGFVTQQTLAVDALQFKIDELADLAETAGADVYKINAIRYRSLASGE